MFVIGMILSGVYGLFPGVRTGEVTLVMLTLLLIPLSSWMIYSAITEAREMVGHWHPIGQGIVALALFTAMVAVWFLWAKGYLPIVGRYARR